MSDPTTTEPTWAEVQAASKQRRSATKTLIINVGTKQAPVPATYVVRMLTQQEKDSIEDRGVKVDIRERGDQKVKTDNGLLKRLFIQHGVVSGPAGWKGTQADLDEVCADVALRDELADAIDKFALLEPETRTGFR